MKIDFNKYPLALLENFYLLKNEFKILYRENIDVILEDKSTDSILFFHMVEPLIDSKFSISEMKLDNKTPYYSISRKPYSRTNNGEKTLLLTHETTLSSFKSWIEILSGFKDVDLNDDFEDQYETELFNNWKIIDEDADKKPFQLHEQIIILGFLNRANEIINEYSLDNVEFTEFESIQSDIILINSSITRLSKNQVMKSISKIVAKGFKHSKKLGIELLVEVKKYIFKELVTNGADFVQKLIEGFTSNQ